MTRAAAACAIALLVGMAAVFMAIPANASAQAPAAQVSPAASQGPAELNRPMGGFECVAYLRLFGYSITNARALACGASYINKPACIAGLIITRVNYAIATAACVI